jgi:hypothetical protein
MILIAWLLMGLGFLLVPVLARQLVDGRRGVAGALLAGFLAVCSLPAHATNPPQGGTSLGVANAIVTCTPGAVLSFVVTGTNAYGNQFDGVCPSGGQVTCGRNTLQGGYYPAQVNSGECYELFLTPQSGTGGGSTTTTLLMPGMTASEGLLIWGAIVSVWGLAFGIRAVRSVLHGGASVDS